MRRREGLRLFATDSDDGDACGIEEKVFCRIVQGVGPVVVRRIIQLDRGDGGAAIIAGDDEINVF